MYPFDSDFFVPFLVFSIPIIAIVGGIVTGIVKVMGRQRMAELMAQERIAAIQRGLDVSKLPPPAPADEDPASAYMSPADRDRRLAQGMMIGGLITLAAGIGLTTFLSMVEENGNAWAVGFIPIAVGLALLLAAGLVKPKS